MARRAAIAFLIALLAEPGDQLWQITAAAFVFAVFLSIHYLYQPFIDDRLNYVERLALLSHLGVATLGILFVPGTSALVVLALRHGLIALHGMRVQPRTRSPTPIPPGWAGV
jgi:hypothetical protein